MPPASRPPDRSLFAALAASAVALGAVTATLAWLTIDRTPDAGAANVRALVPWWIASACGWAALTALVIRLHRTKRPWRRGDGRGAVVVIGIAVVARAVVILTHPPALSDDIYRYIFDGRTLASGANPYLVAPEERRPPDPPTPAQSIPVVPAVLGDAERWAGESAVVRLVNNAELHTIYLPTSQLLFAAAGAIIPDDHADPLLATQVFRALFVALEVAMMIALVIALRGSRRSVWWLAAYAWHPLALTEIAGEGHQDVAGVLLLVTALALYTASPKRIAAPIISLALAVLVKPVALPVAALMLKGRSWRSWLVAAAIGAVICTALLAPFLFTHGGAPLANLRETSARFAAKWAHFGSVYEPVLTAIEHAVPNWTNDPQEQLARTLCASVLALVILGVFLRGRDAWRDAGLIFLAMVLLAPTAHPWYLLWALVLLPMAPLRAVWVASLTLPWGYAALADPDTWAVPPWLMWAAYLPVYAAVIADVASIWQRSRRPA